MTSDSQHIERLPTGVPGLDTVMKGGYAKGGIYIIQGTPGCGKTILASQVCFHHIERGGKALYVTLLAESHARMMVNMSGLSFFKPELVPEKLYYLSAFAALEDQGLRGLLDLVRRELRSHRSSLLIIDGLVAVEESVSSEQEYKKFIHELQSQCSLTGCSAFLLTSGSTRGMRAEKTMVDGLIELANEPTGAKRERYLAVTKFRGGDHMDGNHALQIGDDGIRVFPRIECLLQRPRDEQPPAPESLPFGLPNLDRLLGGGLPMGSTTLFMAPTGSGKTTLGMHFLGTCDRKHRGLYVSFYESRLRACEKAASLGIDLAGQLKSGCVEFLWFPTTEYMLDRAGNEMLDAANRIDARRVFIDGFDGLRQIASDRERVVPFCTALMNEFRARNRTTVYTLEAIGVGQQLTTPPQGVSSIVENLVFMRFMEDDARTERVLAVLKMRDRDFDPALHEFRIEKGGIRLLPLVAKRGRHKPAGRAPDRRRAAGPRKRKAARR